MIRTLQLIVLHETDDEILQATITTSKMRCLSLLSGVISDVYCNYSTSCLGPTRYFLFLKTFCLLSMSGENYGPSMENDYHGNLINDG
jgi:hypothetical protein